MRLFTAIALADGARASIAAAGVPAVALVQGRLSPAGPSYTRVSPPRLVCP